MDRDADARGLSGIYDRVQAEYWKAIAAGTRRPQVAAPARFALVAWAGRSLAGFLIIHGQSVFCGQYPHSKSREISGGWHRSQFADELLSGIAGQFDTRTLLIAQRCNQRAAQCHLGGDPNPQQAARDDDGQRHGE